MVVNNVIIKVVDQVFLKNTYVSIMMDIDTSAANVISNEKQTFHWYIIFKVFMINWNWNCDSCDDIFKTRYSWREHSMSAHEGKMLECSECPFKAQSKKRISIHVLVDHNGVRYIVLNIVLNLAFKSFIMINVVLQNWASKKW